MAAVFTNEQLLEQLFNDKEVSQEEDEVVVEEGDIQQEKLRNYLAKYEPNKNGFNQKLFRNVFPKGPMVRFSFSVLCNEHFQLF